MPQSPTDENCQFIGAGCPVLTSEVLGTDAVIVPSARVNPNTPWDLDVRKKSRSGEARSV
jgi:hypothetical protein